MNNKIKKAVMEALNVANPSITREEAMQDYETANYFENLAEKKAMAAKYGIDSKKAKEIQEQISLYLRDLRHKQSSFDEDDVKNFNRLGYYDSYKKECEMFDQESDEFVDFLLKYRLNYLKKHNLERYVNVVGSLNGYRISLSDKCAINRYRNVVRYKEEHSQAFSNKMDAVEVIYNSFQEQMAEYKAEYLEEVKKWETKCYKEYPVRIDELMKRYEQLHAEYDEYCKTPGEDGMLPAWRDRNDKYEPISKTWSAISKIKAIISRYPTLKEYVDAKVKNASDDFDSDVRSVAMRVNEKKVDVDKLQITQIGRDPKFFEMLVTDGTIKLYARSIWAAENSAYMRPHFRFIITDRSKF